MFPLGSSGLWATRVVPSLTGRPGALPFGAGSGGGGLASVSHSALLWEPSWCFARASAFSVFQLRALSVVGDGSPEAHVSRVPAVGPVSGQLWVVSALGRRAWEEQTQRLNRGVMCSVPDTEGSPDTGEGQQSDPKASSWASSGKRPQGWPLCARWRRWAQRERRGEEEGQHSPG